MIFLMSLALRLGRTLHELETTMTARELAMWIEFDAGSPIGDRRGDIHAAQITSALYRSQGNNVSLEDALLQWNEPEETEDDTAGLESFFESLIT